VTGSKSPLTDIRSAELAAARSVSEATDAAQQAVAEARAAAQDTVERARAEGRATADERFGATVTEAQDVAAGIAEAVDGDIAELRRRVEPQLETLARVMLDALMPGGGA
jgi:vacuolar-type H+-ATPase subunit H